MLKTSKEFDFVYKNSYKFRHDFLDICVLKRDLARNFYARFGRGECDLVGFSVSKKIGNAVMRNLIKRRFRAIWREFFDNPGNHCRDLQNLEASQTPSLASASKFHKSSTSNTANTRIIKNDKFDLSPKNNRIICIFIAKDKIAKTPFLALKSHIFGILHKFQNFGKNDNLQKNGKNPPFSHQNLTQNRAIRPQITHFKGDL